MSQKKKKKRRWNKTARRYTTVAVIAAIAGILLDLFAVIRTADDIDYSDALQITSEAEMASLEGYTGKVVIAGPVTGTTFTFAEAYQNVEMEKSADVAGSFLYAHLSLINPEEYVSNQHDVDTRNVTPEYDIRYAHHGHYHYAKDLSIYGFPLEPDKDSFTGTTDYGTLYHTLTEEARFEGVEGPEASAVVIGEMENGAFTQKTIEIGATIESAVSSAAHAPYVFHALLAVWLLLCGFVVWSMYQQRH